MAKLLKAGASKDAVLEALGGKSAQEAAGMMQAGDRVELHSL